ncbi:G-type lectin S-receptor-like serine/threonine-protein kinase At1g61420 [Geodia barretti]|uniref:G-type lectin S-receptor-like serine/threonine-protein kinase At1g61420 n=1 Tax=Geodia barretti TaxID=519541 RepID=A0AA35TLR2_GEOBA|nr:G-type lectin S-receptor-like serine/threonine-protein kinase At1g61420 [Geodia barretti]
MLNHCHRMMMVALHSIQLKSGKKSVVELIITEFDSELEVIDRHGRDAATIAMEKSYTAEISRYLYNVNKLRQNQLRNSLKMSLKITKVIPTGEVIASGNIIELKILTSGERVAGKVFEIDQADTTQLLMNKLESIKQNANILMNISNENIVGIKGVSFLPDRILPVLLMERMISNLDSYIKNHPSSSLSQRIEILRYIARGLHYLHSLNPPFIHGHLTTDNVLLDLGLKAKIGGFAIASTSRRPIKTQYMPPEAQGGIELSNPSVDIFSLGHLALCTVVREEVGRLLPSQYNEAGKPIVLYEVDRWASSMKNAEEILSEQKSVFQGIKECLSNDPSKRPSAKKLLNMLEADGSKGESKDKDIMEGTSENDRRLYGDAMTQGYVESAFALLILLGVTGSGKSLFQRLVLGLPVPEFSPSTPFAESTIRSMSISRVAVNEKGFKWVIIGPQNMIELVAKEIKTGLKPQNTTKSVSDKDEFRKQFVSEQNDSNGAGKMERENNPAPLKQKCEVPTDPNKQSKVLQQESEVPETTHNAPSKRFSENFLDALKGIKIDSDLMTNSSKDVPQKLMDINFTYLLDSGGQPPFREMLPHLVQQSSAMVLMQKLNERLDFRPTIRYREKEGEVSEGYTSELTNEQMLYQYVQAAQSQKSKVFVIGTHRDMEGECKDETREKKNEKLFEAFRPVIGKQMELYKVGNPDQLMFPVDSTSRGPDDEATAEEFRKKVTTSCMGQKVKIPLPWFVLEQLLQLLAEKMQVRVLSIDECYEAAKLKLLMPYTACEAALTYLGKLNLILYLPNILPGVVFPDAQVILDKITELVRCNHALRTYDSCTDAIPSCMQSNEKLELRDFGQVSSNLLNKAFCSHYRDHLFTSSDFLKLLEGLMIAGKLENGEYFIPSLHPNLPDDNIANYRVTSVKNPAPLVIYYPKMWVPVGIMPTLTVYLRNTCKWVLAGGKPACLYHNCIQFKLVDGKPGSTVLIDSTKFLEVHVSTSLEVDPKLCTKIGQDIMAGLKEAHKSLHYDSAEAMMGFLCSGECGNKEAHLATLDPEREAWLCSENGNKGNYLNERQKYWDGALKITAKGI